MSNLSRRDLLRMLIGTSIVLPAAAKTAYGDESVDPDQLSSLDDLREQIAGIRDQADSLGMADVDFDNLYLGDGIPTHIVEKEGIRFNLYYYPVLSDGQIIFWIIQIDNGLQITSALTDEIGSLVSSDTSFALIYDSECVYLYCEDEYIELLRYPTMPDRGTLDPATIGTIETGAYGTGAALPSWPATRAYNAYVSVPVVRQPSNSKMCWAACAASIVNCRTGNSLTCTDVAKTWYGQINYDKPLPNSDSAKVINLFGLSYKYKSSVPSASLINKNLASGFPIYGCWAYSSGTGHAAVIRGITSSSTLSLMDPLASKFTTAKKSGSSWQGYSGGAGALMTLKAASLNYSS